MMRAAAILLAWLLPLLGAGMAGATPPNVIIAAEYTEPTTRYGHAVLGNNAEWGAMRLTVDKCPGCSSRQIAKITIRLPESRVFEDVAPRIIDLDGDNIPEVVVIETDVSKGARLAVYDETGPITATPFIGRAFRWLAPLGAADLDGDGNMELAYIDRPHLAKTLMIWRYKDQTLTQIAKKSGLTNHRIGETYISGGIRDCGTGPEIISADGNWQKLVATRLSQGKLASTVIADFDGPASFEKALACQ